MNLVIISRVAALLVLWLPGTYCYHLLLLRDVHRKLVMSGEEILDYYRRMEAFFTSPLTAAFLTIINLLMVIFFYEIVSFVLLMALQRIVGNGVKIARS